MDDNNNGGFTPSPALDRDAATDNVFASSLTVAAAGAEPASPAPFIWSPHVTAPAAVVEAQVVESAVVEAPPAPASTVGYVHDGLVALRNPGATGVSFDGVPYFADDNGVVRVPGAAIMELLSHGFEVA